MNKYLLPTQLTIWRN